MFENFMMAYPPDCAAETSTGVDSRLAAVEGYEELLRIGSGATFGGGIVRVHSWDESLRARSLVAGMFREYADVVPVAKGWLGRQYALDFTRADGGAPGLLLVEPGSAEVFEVDCGIGQLFDGEMVEDPATFLAADLFGEWRKVGGVMPARTQCVGFKRPLFFGGDGDVQNLELSDEGVYWNLMGQLFYK